MTIEQFVPLTNGLSVNAGNTTLVIDRARVAGVSDRAVEIAFRIAGTDFAPRLQIERERFASSDIEEIAAIIRRVARRATGY